MKNFKKGALALVAIVSIFGLTGLVSVQAATSVNLSNADSFTVLAGSTITNTGSTVINGNIGLSPGTAVTGFPPGTVNGVQNVANALAIQAQTDLTNAYTNAAGQGPVVTVPTELGGTTKVAGAYDSATGTFGITGTLTLDAQGNPNAVFIFKTSSTLITAGASNIVLANGAQACNVFWQVGSSATLGANSSFKGTILALTSATLTTGANVEGRVLARNGAVTLDSNTINKSTCTVAAATPTPTPAVPTLTPVVAQATPTPTPVFVPTPTPTYATPSVFPSTGIAPQEVNVILDSVIVTAAFLFVVATIFVGFRKPRYLVKNA
ncbi:DUF3494 domain-containing protein [Candidatus Parcubacteria bacterium]|nr:DUF3494 domain-containing protein [Candidatus Parcubacteria bacterium]